MLETLTLAKACRGCIDVPDGNTEDARGIAIDDDGALANRGVADRNFDVAEFPGFCHQALLKNGAPSGYEVFEYSPMECLYWID